MPATPGVDLQIILTAAFYIVAFFYTVFSTILYYHWNQYALNARVRTISLVAYFVCTLPCIGVAWLMIIAA